MRPSQHGVSPQSKMVTVRMYLGAALAYVKKAMFRGIGVEGFAKIFDSENEV